MRLIIPDNLKDSEVFLQLKVMFDEMKIEQFDPKRSYDLPSLYELLRLTNPNLTEDNIRFLYNTIFAKKGLLQVIYLMSKYMNFELNEYTYEDYNLSLIDIDRVTTENGTRFLELLNQSLNALLFFGSLNVLIQEMIQLLEVVLYYNSPESLMFESSYNELTPIYNG